MNANERGKNDVGLETDLNCLNVLQLYVAIGTHAPDFCLDN